MNLHEVATTNIARTYTGIAFADISFIVTLIADEDSTFDIKVKMDMAKGTAIVTATKSSETVTDEEVGGGA
jgi:hypothetical protein